MESFHRAIKVLLVVLLLAVAVGWIVRWVGESRLAAAREEFEISAGSLSLADYVRPDLEDSVNAAVCLRAGAEITAIPEDGREVMVQILDQEIGSWSEETLSAAAALVDSNREAFEQLERSLDLEDSSFGFRYEEGLDAVLPPMVDLLRSGRLVAVDLRLALAAWETERVSRDVRILRQLSRALGRESFLVSALLHLGVERLYLGAIRDIIAADIADGDLLVHLKDDLEQEGEGDALRRSIAREAAAVLNMTGLRGNEADSISRRDELLLWLFEPYQLAALLDTYAGFVRSLEDPWIETLEDRRSGSSGVLWGPHQIMAPNLLDAVDKVKATELSRRLAVQALELQRMRLESSQLPRNLDLEIVDPYASGTVIYEWTVERGAELSAPEAIELWESEHQGSQGIREPVFRWRLPAPSS